MYKPSETSGQPAQTSTDSATSQAERCADKPTRYLSDPGQLELLRWAGRKDEAVRSRMFDRRIALESRIADCADPRLVRELNELPRYCFTHLRLVELLLTTDCTLKELWSLRWSDVTPAPEGLDLWLHSRRRTIHVADGSLDGVPHVSEWVFAGQSWNRFEREWRQLGKTVYLPEDIWS